MEQGPSTWPGENGAESSDVGLALARNSRRKRGEVDADGDTISSGGNVMIQGSVDIVQFNDFVFRRERKIELGYRPQGETKV